MIPRRATKVVKVGTVFIGGRHPVVIQSMTKTRTADAASTVKQIRELEKAGCEIVRLAIKDDADARSLKKIKPQVRIPVVADIHFHWKLALLAIENGADKIRLNPGNIQKKEHIRQIVNLAKAYHIPIRVGVNSGSVGKQRSGSSMAELMVKNALNYIKIFEQSEFHDIVVSLKASNIIDTIAAYRKMSKVSEYPLHVGVTATGSAALGGVKSSIAIGALLLEGIGDTIRVSLTDTPQEEVRAARRILEALDMRHFGPEIISCPTCGRCEVDLVRIVKALEKELSAVPAEGGSASGGSYQLSPPKAGPPAAEAHAPKIAVMGCVVNGPGEAREADIGVAFGKNEGLLFKSGVPVRKIPAARCVETLVKEIKDYR